MKISNYCHFFSFGCNYNVFLIWVSYGTSDSRRKLFDYLPVSYLTNLSMSYLATDCELLNFCLFVFFFPQTSIPKLKTIKVENNKLVTSQ